MFFKGELNPKINFSSFEHLGIVEQLYVYVMSAVVYDIGHTRMIKTRKNTATVCDFWLL